MRDYLVLRVITKLLLPPILLFGLYLQAHGEFSAGGGFQAGVILASALILYALIYDYDLAMEVVPEGVLLTLIPLGVLLYGAIGLAGIVLGGNFLDYAVFNTQHPAQGQVLGVFLVELGVGITVSSVMLGIFMAFLRHWQEPPS